MQFTYKIENYYPYEGRVFVVYTPEDVAYEPLGGWVSISADMTLDQVKAAVVDAAPILKWDTPKSTIAADLVGLESSGAKVQAPPPEPEPEPVPIVPPPPTPEQIKDAIVRETQMRLDKFALERNYDGILSACTYVTSSVPKFATEGQYAVSARDATWAALYALMGDVQAGERPIPTGFSDVEPILPVLAWPE